MKTVEDIIREATINGQNDYIKGEQILIGRAELTRSLAALIDSVEESYQEGWDDGYDDGYTDCEDEQPRR